MLADALRRPVAVTDVDESAAREEPDPQRFLKACADLGVGPRATLMVGDNPVRDGAAACERSPGGARGHARRPRGTGRHPAAVAVHAHCQLHSVPAGRSFFRNVIFGEPSLLSSSATPSM
ncbi:HAD family hydrolase [Streptomyces sp. NPDC020898]|uniref:HAD family hydrolase n=1 Tax=Streptomyces sp. NPDC020898 TaxID=3365101 RepID=UPI003789D185